jgi:23S rRNA (adenine2030-N6)-methyltransferase
MNYRHAFHAGNFADVVKHLTLARVIDYLRRKAAPFRFIDTHAGIGLYDLAGEAGARSPEWQKGIARLYDGPGFTRLADAKSEVGSLLAPYLDIVEAVNREKGADRLRYYPGAGEIARRMMRADDRIVVNELHPTDARLLREQMARDRRVVTMEIDGWTAVKSLLPPKERRGVVLIDPPFEQAGDFKRLEAALEAAHSRFDCGIVMLWYPIKAGAEAGQLTNRIGRGVIRRLLAVELTVRHREQPGGLNGSGLIIRNPPFGLDKELEVLLPWLQTRLGEAVGSRAQAQWLVGE